MALSRRYPNRLRSLFIAAATTAVLASPVRAASCGDGAAGFQAWLEEFKQEAAAQGVSRSVLQSALGGVEYDSKIISRDRSQGIFKRSFGNFSARLLTPSRIAKGGALLRQHAELLQRIERQYGVPGPVIVAIWGLETNFGAANGNLPIFRSVATLAYDCRRSENFKQELMAALMIVQRGYMRASAMRGDWAGEIGQTQLMPTSYLKYAVDFDGDGSADLIHDTADALASTANFLRAKGWRPGAGWDEGEPNFQALLEWNQATVYAKTLAAFADILAGRRQQ